MKTVADQELGAVQTDSLEWQDGWSEVCRHSALKEHMTCNFASLAEAFIRGKASSPRDAHR